MARREADPSYRNRLLNALGIDAPVVKNDDAAEGMSDQADRIFADDIQQGGKIEHVLRETVDGARSPGAVAVAAEVERIYVVSFAEGPSDPIPIAGMIQTSMNKDECGLTGRAVVPKLEFQAI
jgi:hypothetical protein